MGCACTRESSVNVVKLNTINNAKVTSTTANNNNLNLGSSKNNLSMSTNNYLRSGRDTFIPSVKINYNTKNQSFVLNYKNKDFEYINNNEALAYKHLVNYIKDKHYNIFIYFPGNIRQVLHPISDNKDYILLYDLFNNCLFMSNEFDCNFISIYDRKLDDYNYIIERINYNTKYNRQHKTTYNKSYKSSVNNNNVSYKSINSNGNSTLNNKSENIITIYINNIAEDFGKIVRDGRVVSKDDLIEIKYEDKLSTTKINDIKV